MQADSLCAPEGQLTFQHAVIPEMFIEKPSPPNMFTQLHSIGEVSIRQQDAWQSVTDIPETLYAQHASHFEAESSDWCGLPIRNDTPCMNTFLIAAPPELIPAIKQEGGEESITTASAARYPYLQVK